MLTNDTKQPNNGNTPSPAGVPQVTGAPQVVTGVPGKEKEPGKTAESYLSEVGKEHEIAPEVEEAGVVVRKENIEIPPDIASMGIRPTGTAVPVSQTASVKLPITDEKIVEGQHLDIFHSLRWLAEWCIFLLKRMHLKLKVIHGRVTRIRSKT